MIDLHSLAAELLVLLTANALLVSLDLLAAALARWLKVARGPGTFDAEIQRAIGSMLL